MVALVIMAFGQAAEGSTSREDYYEEEAAKNDDLGVGDRCDNLSPYTKDQLAKHIKLNTRDLEKLKDSIDSRLETDISKRDSRADLVDKALTDLQKKITLLSEQRDQDREKIAQLERTLSDTKKHELSQ